MAFSRPLLFSMMITACQIGWCQPHRCGVTYHPDISKFNSPSQTIAYSRSEFIVPVVFHIVEGPEDQLISDDQVLLQLQILNDAYSGQREIDKRVPLAFRNVAGIPNIRFCLAQTDPLGNAVLGMTRTPTAIQNIADEVVSDGRRSLLHRDLGGQSAWDTDRYINIWVGNSARFIGMSSFPNTTIIEGEDGIIIDPDFFGSFVTGTNDFPYHLGKTLIHEMGHYFNLPHIWGPGNGGDCGSDDGIEDTPLQISPYLDCPEEGISSCGSDDMFYNYMDFTDDRCLFLFTQDQSAIMQDAILAFRNGLLQSGLCDIPDTSIPDLLSVYHEPFTNYLQISYQSGDGEEVEYLLYDIQGRKVANSKSSVFERDYLSIPTLKTGAYILYVVVGNNIYQEKVMLVN